MKERIMATYGIIVSFILLSAGLAVSQSTETTAPQQATAGQTATPAPAQTEKAEPETEWLWGEVVAVDPATNEIKVKTLDYKNDTEIEVALNVDDKTTYENLKSINEIKPKDSLSIDYVVGPDGKNLAKNISLEKAEEAVPAPATADTGTTSNTDNSVQQENTPSDSTKQ